MPSLAKMKQAASLARQAYNYYRRTYTTNTRYLRGTARRQRAKARRSLRMVRAKRTRFTTRNIGDRPGTSNCKRNQTFQVNQQIPTRTLQSSGLTLIGRGDDINLRERDIINIRGFLLQNEWKNTRTNPVMVNWAIIQPKNSKTVTTVDFCRGKGNTNRAIDFSVNQSTADLNYASINTDIYHVIKHKRFQLGPAGSNTIPDWKRQKLWVPLKRQLRFTDDTTGSCETPIFFVYWCDEINRASGSAAVNNALDVTYEHYIYFRETRS